MLQLLDTFLTLLHLIIIFFNLFAWIPRRTRRAHLVVAGITLSCWFIIGIWKGMGYCPLTDWQWDLKRRLGEGPLPQSFVTWFINAHTPFRITDAAANRLTGGLFAGAILASLYVNFRSLRIKERGK